ncbi:MAG: hypothetical protein QM594_05645 [Niabella sp.]
MLKNFLALFLILFSAGVFGQNTEFRLALNSGLFSFSGASAQKYSRIIVSGQANSGYTSSPYGSAGALSYGLSGNLKRVTKNNLMLGVDAGFETLRSKVKIDGIHDGAGDYESAKGKTFLSSNFINLFPFIGRRFYREAVSFDIVGGFDIAYCLKATEKGSASAADGTKYTTSRDRKTISTDFRPRIQFSADYKNTGVYLGYSQGLINYRSGAVGGTNICLASFLRFGLTYCIK